MVKTFVCVSLRYRKCHGGIVVCGKICGNIGIGIDIGFGKIEALSDWKKKIGNRQEINFS